MKVLHYLAPLFVLIGCGPALERLPAPVSEPSHAYAPEAYRAGDRALVVPLLSGPEVAAAAGDSVTVWWTYQDLPDGTSWTPVMVVYPADSLTHLAWLAVQRHGGEWPAHCDLAHLSSLAREVYPGDSLRVPWADSLYLAHAVQVRLTNYAMGDSLPAALPQLSPRRRGGSPVIPLWAWFVPDRDTMVVLRFITTPPDPRVGWLEDARP